MLQMGVSVILTVCDPVRRVFSDYEHEKVLKIKAGEKVRPLKEVVLNKYGNVIANTTIMRPSEAAICARHFFFSRMLLPQIVRRSLR